MVGWCYECVVRVVRGEGVVRGGHVKCSCVVCGGW